MARAEVDVMQGTLDLLVLKALSWDAMHGYNILDWLRRATHGELRIEDAALYPALHRMEARGWVESEWGASEKKKRAKFYRLTAAGRRALRAETETWNDYVAAVARVMTAIPEPA